MHSVSISLYSKEVQDHCVVYIYIVEIHGVYGGYSLVRLVINTVITVKL